MRKLTAGQKKIINAWMDVERKRGNQFLSIDDMPSDIYTRLRNINDTEILYQEVNRYIMDESFKRETRPSILKDFRNKQSESWI